MSIKVQGITICNFKNIQREKISINGNHVYVLGRNAMGKTSFLDAIFKPLTGKNMPDEPVMQGQRRGSIELDMGEFLVVAKFNDKNQKVAIEVQTKDGANYPSPRTYLDSLTGVVDFNLDNFFKKTAKEQLDFVKKLIDIDFTDLDDEYKLVYDKRTFVNKKVEELEAQSAVFDKNNLEPVDISKETLVLSEKRKFNQEVEEGKRFVQEKITEKDHALIEIQDLEDKIKSLKAKVSEIEKEIEPATQWLADPENQPFNIETEEAALLKKIEDNKLVEANVRNKKTYDDLVIQLDQQKLLNERLAEIQLIKRNCIAEANIPVPGLSLNDDGLTYNGLPFSPHQINKAQQIIIGLQINLWLLKDVKIARFEGSLVDDENMEYIMDWADKNDVQLFVEIVDRSAEKLRIEVKEVL
jgi:predicted ATP-dependent endonuclease of OLD family